MTAHLSITTIHYLNRSAKPQAELDEVAGGDSTVAVEVEDVAGATKDQAELDEVVGSHGAIAVGVAEEAEDFCNIQGVWRCGFVEDVVIAGCAVAVAIEAGAGELGGKSVKGVATVGQ